MKDGILITEGEPLGAFDLKNLVHKLDYCVCGIANDLARTPYLALYGDVAFLAEGQAESALEKQLMRGFAVLTVFPAARHHF